MLKDELFMLSEYICETYCGIEKLKFIADAIINTLELEHSKEQINGVLYDAQTGTYILSDYIDSPDKRINIIGDTVDELYTMASNI